MCLIQGPQRSDGGEARSPSVSSQALYHCAPYSYLLYGVIKEYSYCIVCFLHPGTDQLDS